MRFRVSWMIAVCSLATVTVGCKSTLKSSPETRATVESMPPWVKNPPVATEKYLYGVGTFESPSTKLALSQAHAVGRVEIALQLKVQVADYLENFERQSGKATDSELLAHAQDEFEGFTNQTLVGSRVKEQSIIPKEGTYVVWALMELPLDAANKALLAKINADKALKSRYEATKAYQELEDKVKESEKSLKP